MKPTIVDEYTSLNKFEDWMAFMSDPKKPMQLLEKVKEERAATEKALKELNMKGKASSLLATATEQKAESERLLTMTQEECKKLKNEAKVAIEDDRAKLEEAQRELTATTKDRAEGFKRRQRELDNREKTVVASTEALAERDKELSAALADAKATKERYEALIDGIQGVAALG